MYRQLAWTVLTAAWGGWLVFIALRPPLNYNCADLAGGSLERRQWAHAHLSSADLQGADLRGSDLRGADLSHACLRVADLRGTDLRGANLSGANLSGADLREARLAGANLEGACYSCETHWPNGFQPERHGGYQRRADSPWHYFRYATGK